MFLLFPYKWKHCKINTVSWLWKHISKRGSFQQRADMKLRSCVFWFILLFGFVLWMKRRHKNSVAVQNIMSSGGTQQVFLFTCYLLLDSLIFFTVSCDYNFYYNKFPKYMNDLMFKHKILVFNNEFKVKSITTLLPVTHISKCSLKNRILNTYHFIILPPSTLTNFVSA